ncbi:MAG: UDP-forming cellulose synthase catalytic subunit [Gammaproteobacteria bacterium]|nr:UDP-forming cellulose synthase catalytic subunit [Gammaproteobacteria bacterium]
MLTPPGRPLQVGWAQEFARWLWHLIVLPPELARPWPAWLRRPLRPLVLKVATEIGIVNLRSVRAWALHLTLLAPPSGPWSQPEEAAQRRPVASLAALLHYPLAPRLAPLLYGLAAGLERYSAVLASAYLAAGRTTRIGLNVLAFASFALIATTPLETGPQLALLALMWLLSLLVRQLPGYGPGLLLITFSIVASSRYVWWRCTHTMDLSGGFELFFGAGLLAAECYTWLIMLLGYAQNARPLRRKPVALPRERALWPSVDVYVPTYNEPLEVVRPTVLAALNLDWPADRLKVYILDDGRRAAFREFASECGAEYLVRSNNAHAKAGNLNHALRVTAGEFVAIFDCDHIPVRTFLTTTMGWFLKDTRCAMLQTPHHFFSPDPFERNLGTFRRVPNEGNLFYGLIQDGNDLWNAAFFCGSCAVLRRGPLQEIGGIAVETVTEDAHTALKLHRRGYTTAYLREVLAGGLATESLSGHIGQRIRWARGMAQIFRLDNPLFGPGLTALQRLCYSNAMLHFFSGVPRLVFLTAPLAYLYFQFHIINAAAASIALYAGPHLVQSSLANSHIQGRFRHSFWNEAYEAVLSWYIALPTTVALLAPHRGKFNVTAKGGLVEREFFDWRIAMPYLVLVLLNAGGALVAVPRLLFWNAFEADTVLLNLIWTLFNIILLGAVLGVAAETRQVRAAPRVPKRLPATLHLPSGGWIACETSDFAMAGLGLSLSIPQPLSVGTRVRVTLTADDGPHEFPAEVATVRAEHVGLLLEELSVAQQRAYVRCTFGARDAWKDWDSGIREDKPLASFAEVFSFGATGYVRLLQSLRHRLLAWRQAAAPAG